jgi:hypothetical protein
MSNYKTQLCLHFKNSGTCWYGDKCNFAHGKAELRKYSEPKTAPKLAKIAPKIAKIAPNRNLFAELNVSEDEPEQPEQPETDEPEQPETDGSETDGSDKFSWADEMENDFTFMNTKPLCYI